MEIVLCVRGELVIDQFWARYLIDIVRILRILKKNINNKLVGEDRCERIVKSKKFFDINTVNIKTQTQRIVVSALPFSVVK